MFYMWVRPLVLSPSYRQKVDILSRLEVYHVTLRIRPSHFSARNIENLGMGLGMRLLHYVMTVLWSLSSGTVGVV